MSQSQDVLDFSWKKIVKLHVIVIQVEEMLRENVEGLVKYVLYTVHCTLYTINSTVYIVQCALCNVQFLLCSSCTFHVNNRRFTQCRGLNTTNSNSTI